MSMWDWIRKLRGRRSKPVEAIRQTRNDAAVVFIHGYLGNAKDTWGRFFDLVTDHPGLKGWDVFAVSYSSRIAPDFLRRLWSADPAIDKLARRLETTLKSSLEQYRSIALVAHSMGGLVVQKALLEADIRSRISHVFLFGTPSCGTGKARFIRYGKRQIRDMQPGSSFVRDLRLEWDETFGAPTSFKATFELHVAAGSEDEFVNEKSSLGPFAKKMQHVVPGDHSEMVKPQDKTNPSFQLVAGKLTGGPTDPFDGARLAVEQRDFHRAVRKFKGRVSELDAPALVQYAIALDHTGKREEAIDVLRSHGRSETDAMGALAGRFKRRWKLERTKSDAKEALDLYQRAYESTAQPDQQYYHAINIAFMYLTYKRNRAQATEWADRALEHCEVAPKGIWRLATMGEAYLVHRQDEKALSHYEYALSLQPEPWKTRSMYEQAVEVARAVDLPGGTDPLRHLFESYERGTE